MIQINGASSPSEVDAFLSNLIVCVVASRMRSNRLEFKPPKTKFTRCTAGLSKNCRPATAQTVDSASKTPVYTVRELGTFVEPDSIMRTRVCLSLLLVLSVAPVSQFPPAGSNFRLISL